MTFRSKDTVEQALCQLFPSAWLEEQAQQTGLVQRHRKIHPLALFWTLVLSFGIGKARSIALLRRAYEAATGTLLSASSFYERFTAALVLFLQQACARALGQLTGVGTQLQGALSAFEDVLISDATILRLHDLLKSTYAACRTNHTQAAAKLHVVLSVLGLSEQKIKVTGERKHDAHVWTIGPWVRGRLLLFDLGFFWYALFARIVQQGGFFISRLKEGSNPTIVAVYQGDGRQLIGQSLQTALLSVRREILDVQVAVTYKKRVYGGKRRSANQCLRLVGIKNPLTGTYHLYLTNILPDQLGARAIAQVYSARWLVELLFKALKSFYQLEGFPSQNIYVVQALIYAAVITLLVSRHLEQALRRLLAAHQAEEETRNQLVFPWLRLAAVLTTLSAPLLLAVLQQAGLRRAPLSLTELILKEAQDPNQQRDSILRRLQNI